MQGVYRSCVDDMFVKYVKPSENGGRGDVQWVALLPKKTERDKNGVYRGSVRSDGGWGLIIKAASYRGEEVSEVSSFRSTG